MNRKEFIRTSLLATFGAALSLELPVRAVATVRALKTSFKVSKELLADSTAFNQVLDQHYAGQDILKMEMGWEEDDFTRNLQTVVLTLKK